MLLTSTWYCQYISKTRFWFKIYSSSFVCFELIYYTNVVIFSFSELINNFGGNSYRNCRSSKSQAKQHEEWNCLLGWFNVRHAKTPIIAAKSRVYRFEDICEFEEIEANHRWCQYRQLRMKDKEDQFILPDIQAIHRKQVAFSPSLTIPLWFQS